MDAAGLLAAQFPEPDFGTVAIGSTSTRRAFFVNLIDRAPPNFGPRARYHNA